jgi:hypothetical protein
MKKFGKPAIVVPRCPFIPSRFHASPSVRPPTPSTMRAIGGGVTSKPVAKTIASVGCSSPSAVTIACGRTSAIGLVTTSALGCDSAG